MIYINSISNALFPRLSKKYLKVDAGKSNILPEEVVNFILYIIENADTYTCPNGI